PAEPRFHSPHDVGVGEHAICVCIGKTLFHGCDKPGPLREIVKRLRRQQNAGRPAILRNDDRSTQGRQAGLSIHFEQLGPLEDDLKERFLPTRDLAATQRYLDTAGLSAWASAEGQELVWSTGDDGKVRSYVVRGEPVLR